MLPTGVAVFKTEQNFKQRTQVTVIRRPSYFLCFSLIKIPIYH